MQVIELVETMRHICMDLHRQGKQIRFVPTMGSLHKGHVALIERAAGHLQQQPQHHHQQPTGVCQDNSSNVSIIDASRSGEPAANDRINGKQKPSADDDADINNIDSNGTNNDKRAHSVIVSIFVNPIQFNNFDDFKNYPSTLANDLEICKQTACVDYVFVPKYHQIYPIDNNSTNGNNDGTKTNTKPISIDLIRKRSCRLIPPANSIAQDLEGRSRPGHFEGMLTVVCKLFNIITPDWAFFGEKDYQQLLLVTNMVEDLSMMTKICRVSTIREVGTNLPLSSRNVRLSLKQRKYSGSIMYDILKNSKEALEQKCSQKFLLDSCPMQIPLPDLDTILLGSMLTSQCINSVGANEVGGGDDDDEEEELLTDLTNNPVKIDYFELRCAHDLSPIKYNHDLELYDCQCGCIENCNKDGVRGVMIGGLSNSNVLKCRLLISVIVANVRLLDNMEVNLNL